MRTHIVSAGLLSALLCSVAVPASAQSAVGGFYVGGQAGIDWNEAKFGSSTESVSQATNGFVTGRGLIVVPGTTSTVPAHNSSTSGAVYGGQVGYDAPMGTWLLGVEGEYTTGGNSLTQKNSATLPSTGITPATAVTETRSANPGNAWAINARIGTNVDVYQSLVYAIGGLAGTSVDMHARDTWASPGGPAASGGALPTANFGPMGPVITTASDKHDLMGWTLGAGIERAIGSNVGVALEYRHTDYGSHTYRFNKVAVLSSGAVANGNNGAAIISGQANPGATRVSMDNDRVMLKVNYHLDGF